MVELAEVSVSVTVAVPSPVKMTGTVAFPATKATGGGAEEIATPEIARVAYPA